MYLEQIKIENYFSIKNITIDNLKDLSEIYFVGENGAGKTILLQAIARAVKGEQRIGAVIDVLEQNPQKENASFNANLLKRINLFAYGINRLSIKGLEEIDFRNEEVYVSLYDNSRNLTNPVYWLQMLELDKQYNKKNITPEDVQNLFSELLEKEVTISFDGSKVIFDEKGTKLSFNQLSDGYKSSITWIADLLARLSENQPDVKKLSDFEAIVLVDEIGIFLHPKLRYNITKKLRSKFPKIQWFFTTHSPIILLGASENAGVFKIYKEDGETVISEKLDLKNHTANSLLTSNFWGLDKFYSEYSEPEYLNYFDDTYKKIYEIVQQKKKDNFHTSEKNLIELIESVVDENNFVEEPKSQYKTDNKPNTNPVIIQGKEDLPIRIIANEVFNRLKREFHPLTEHIWGDNETVVPNVNNGVYEKWYPIGVLPEKSPKHRNEFIILYDIARRSNNHNVSGLFINIAFNHKEFGKKLFDKFVDNYQTLIDDYIYQKTEWDKNPRIALKLMENCNSETINEEIELLYININQFYQDWHFNVLEFIKKENLSSKF